MNAQSSKAIPQRSGTSWLGLAVIGTVLAMFLIVAWNRCSQPALTDYEGVIVDRQAGFRSTEEGDQAYFRLLIQPDNGGRITVNVDGETYGRAQVGMKIKRRQGKIELTAGQAERAK